MLVCASVVGCQAVSGAVALNISVSTDQGHEISTQITVTTLQAAVQINNAIEQAAKDGLKNALGIVVTGADTIKVFGGAVL